MRLGTTTSIPSKYQGDLLTYSGKDDPWHEVFKRLKPDAATMESPLARKLTGRWALVKSGEHGDGAVHSNDFKFCVDGHWCNTFADPKSGVVVTHDGGTYTLDGDTFFETVDYANPDCMNLIGHTFKFKIRFSGDTLTKTGIDNPWNEVWKRAD